MKPGQITLEHAFGRCLKRLAKQAEIIVEIGTFFGEGSTRCLHAGMTRPTQCLVSIDFNEKALCHAKAIYRDDKRVVLIHGTLTLPEEFEDFAYPDPTFIQYYEPEKALNATSPYVLNLMPLKIDLLLIDGGCWTSVTEFKKLWERSQVIALDDTNKEKEHKNWRNRDFLKDLKWPLIEEDLNERNGFSVFRRP